MKLKIIISSFVICFLFSCGNSNENNNPNHIDSTKIVEKDTQSESVDKGIGPIKNVELNHHVDKEISAVGKTTFDSKCSACHKMNKRFIGPSLDLVTKRRSPEWIMNMILNPDQMVKENKVAKELLMEYISPMANQSLTEEEARSILEYFIENDNNKS
jgi:cytochrome c551/c552